MKNLRTLLLGILLLGILGTTAELLLLGHYEDPWQLAPLVVMALGLAALVWGAVAPSVLNLRILRIVMAIFLVTGILGLWMHFWGNAEFEKEMYPSMTGLTLIWESLRGATPALAPATMIWFGLLGLAFTFRHPHLTSSSKT